MSIRYLARKPLRKSGCACLAAGKERKGTESTTVADIEPLQISGKIILMWDQTANCGKLRRTRPPIGLAFPPGHLFSLGANLFVTG